MSTQPLPLDTILKDPDYLALSPQDRAKVLAAYSRKRQPSGAGLEPFGGVIPSPVAPNPIKVGASEEAEAQRLALADPRIRAAQDFQPPDVVGALPSLGAAAGAALAAPGVVTSPMGAAFGGAAGEAAKQLIDRASGRKAPATSGEAAGEIAVEGAGQGALELITRGMGKIVSGVGKNFFSRINSRRVASALANEISKAESPAQFGAALTQAYDEVKKKAREAIQGELDAVGHTQVDVKGTIRALENAKELIVSTVGRQTARAGDSAAGKAISIIDEQMDALKLRGGVTDVSDLWEKDSALATFARELDPSISTRASGMVRDAIDADFSRALSAGDYAKFQGTRARFAELAGMSRAHILSNVFSRDKVSPGLIGTEIVKDPETALEAVKLINKKGEVMPLRRVQRALFLEAFQNGGSLPKNISSDMVKEVWGPQAKKVEKFFDAVAHGHRRGGFLNFGSASIGPGNIRIGGSEEAAAIVEIPYTKVAEILDKPEVLDEFVKLANAEKWGAAGAQSIRVILAALEATGRKEKLSAAAQQEKERLAVTP